MTPTRKDPDQSCYSGRFAARLRELREDRQLTVQKVADLIGVRQQTVSNWETGHSSPDLDLFPALAKILRTSVRSLMPKD